MSLVRVAPPLILAQVWSPLKYVVALAVPDANLAVGTVPEPRFDAFRDVKLAPETAPKEPDQVPEVTVPVVVKLAEPAKGDAPRVL